jgi:hypothetical protein
MSMNVSIRHMREAKKVKQEYKTAEAMVNDQVPSSTQINNQVMARQASRRRKIRVVDDDAHNRKDKIKKRLQEKLRKKKAAQSQT